MRVVNHWKRLKISHYLLTLGLKKIHKGNFINNILNGTRRNDDGRELLELREVLILFQDKFQVILGLRFYRKVLLPGNFHIVC